MYIRCVTIVVGDFNRTSLEYGNLGPPKEKPKIRVPKSTCEKRGICDSLQAKLLRNSPTRARATVARRRCSNPVPCALPQVSCDASRTRHATDTRFRRVPPPSQMLPTCGHNAARSTLGNIAPTSSGGVRVGSASATTHPSNDCIQGDYNGLDARNSRKVPLVWGPNDKVRGTHRVGRCTC